LAATVYVVDNNILSNQVLTMIEPVDTLTLLDVARELGRSLEQVRRYVREGKLPAQKLGMQWFVSRQDLKTFEAGGKRAAPDDVLARARTLREGIQRRVGRVDVVELLDESRRTHP
jgi:excisionase family DNA binding protein